MDSRLLAAQTLLSRKYIGDSMDELLSKYKISDLDRRFYIQLVLGVTKHKLLIDYLISNISDRTLDQIEPKVLVILELGIYQISSLKVPDFAAVNESAALASDLEVAYAKGFINAILRNYIRNQRNIRLPKDKMQSISIKHSHPMWIVRMWTEKYGMEKAEKLMIANNQKSAISIRANSTKINRDDLLEKLLEVGAGARLSDISKQGIVITNLGENRLKKLPGFAEGEFIIQDESSQLVVDMLSPEKDDLCIDVCASPGGKTTHLAEYSENVYGFDLVESKILRLVQNFERLDLMDRVTLRTVDAMEPDEELFEKADIVLVDSPCSGLGIIRRKPDIRYNKTPEMIEKLTEVQAVILEQSSKYLKSGGKMVYSTCTLVDAENEDQVKNFLHNHSDFELLDERTTLPSEEGCDGFYIAVMVKK